MNLISRAKAWAVRLWARVTSAAKAGWRKLTAFLLTLLVGIGVISYAALVGVSWDHPTSRTDGTPLPLEEIAETRWYCDGEFVAAFPAPDDAGQLELGIGSHECHATTVDTVGQESDPSVTITRIVNPAKPNPPTPHP